MFVTSGQFYIFIFCVVIGCLCGILLSIANLIKKIIRIVFLGYIIDVICFIASTVIFILTSNYFMFGNFRLYMFIGVILGLVIYMLTINFAIANIVKVLYNKIKVKEQKEIKRNND